MIFLNSADYKNFVYTKIQVPITLNECPSDHEDSAYYLDIKCDALYQEDCYIGMQKIKRIDIRRIRAANGSGKIVAPQWMVEIVIAEVKKEEEVIEILDELCYFFSLACGKYHSLFQYSGLSGFSYRSMDVKRRYAAEDETFGDIDFNHRSVSMEMHTLNTLPEDVFLLPQSRTSHPELFRKLDRAFLTAMQSGDVVARYILLYYLFEIMYDTDEYKNLKNTYEAAKTGAKKNANEKRSKLLYQYLKQEFGITHYRHFDKQSRLTPDTLCEIIKTRNDLTHRADTSKITKMMYHHMLPILQYVLKRHRPAAGQAVQVQAKNP